MKWRSRFVSNPRWVTRRSSCWSWITPVSSFFENVPAEQIAPLCMIECPRLIFPYVRRVISDVTRDGGYPPLNIDQIDFVALFRNEIARRQAEVANAPAHQA